MAAAAGLVAVLGLSLAEPVLAAEPAGPAVQTAPAANLAAAPDPTPPPNPSDDDIGSSEQEAQDAAARVGELSGQVTATESKINSLQVDMETKAELANKALVDLDIAKDDAAKADQAAEAAAAEAERAGQDITAAEDKAAEFAAASFRNGSRLGSITALLGAESPTDLLQRDALLQQVSESQLDVIGDLEAARNTKANSDAAARAARDKAVQAQQHAEDAAQTAEIAKQAAVQALTNGEQALDGLNADLVEQQQAYESALNNTEVLKEQREAYNQWLAEKKAEEERQRRAAEERARQARVEAARQAAAEQAAAQAQAKAEAEAAEQAKAEAEADAQAAAEAEAAESARQAREQAKAEQQAADQAAAEQAAAEKASKESAKKAAERKTAAGKAKTAQKAQADADAAAEQAKADEAAAQQEQASAAKKAAQQKAAASAKAAEQKEAAAAKAKAAATAAKKAETNKAAAAKKSAAARKVAEAAAKKADAERKHKAELRKKATEQARLDNARKAKEQADKLKAIRGKGTGKGAYFQNCDAARAADFAPMRKGEPGYRSALDPNGNGVACDAGTSSDPSTPSPGTGSGSGASVPQDGSKGSIVVNAALAYLGTPYSWGGGNASGPTTGFTAGCSSCAAFDPANTVGFDCSGLALYAWAQAGVSLPHYSAYQYNSGRHISRENLQPGDLVFFANNTNDPNTIHHVAIYMGNNQLIEAPQSGVPVRIRGWRTDGYIGATRPGT